jgi:hypothetical protein
MESTQAKSKPVAKYQHPVHKDFSLALWDDGNCTVSRSYRDKTGAWHNYGIRLRPQDIKPMLETIMAAETLKA